jgi:hypothetical protein
MNLDDTLTINVKGMDGKEIEFGKLITGKKVVLVFLRHFG